ncbi:MAG TPA: glycosyltransferase [Paludibacter sp.]|nr:glycosyltransferase [Paludibacter sp.]
MPDKILFLCTAHYSLDDRVFYHQAKSLSKNGYEVYISSTKEEFSANIDGIKISSYCDNLLSQNQKKKKIVEKLTSISPDIIICDSPMSVVASSLYRKKYSARIIYDVTEWYPSKKNFPNTTGIVKWLKAIVLLSFNLLAGFKTDSFIFGEYYKSIVFRTLTCWKPFIFLPYYPDLKYIKQYPVKKEWNEINFLYTGVINADKGIFSVLDAVQSIAKKIPQLNIRLKIIGYYTKESEKIAIENIISSLSRNINIEIHNILPFEEFCQVVGDTDFFLDLRKKDFENTHCLPIKLFYYLACGRPVIYTDLNSIKKDIKEFNFGKLVNTKDVESIAGYIQECVSNIEFYNSQCESALEYSKKHYNWAIIEKKFLTHISFHSKAVFQYRSNKQ